MRDHPLAPMTAEEIARRLEAKPLTVDRVLKARNLAKRFRVEWSTVVAAMSEEGRAQV